ncbi:MAG: multiheme c-type cytochrome [Pirellulales bacterium]
MSSSRIMRRLVGIPWPPLLGVVLMLSLSVALLVRRTIQTPEPQPAGPLTILVSGDTQGLLFPGDCGPGQAGGLARRGEIVRQAQAAGTVLYAELGNAPAGNTPYDRLKFSAILRGEMAMDLAAHNVGPGEMRLGIDELQRLASELKVPFVSTNVRDAQGRPLAEPLRLIEAAGHRIALVGIVSPSYAEEPLEVLDPAAAIEAALAEKAMPYDTLLVLAYLPADELSQLAARLPKRAVLVGPSHADPLEESEVGRVGRVREAHAQPVGSVGRVRPSSSGRAERVVAREADVRPESAQENVAGLVGRQGRSLVRIDFGTSDREQWTAGDVAVAGPMPEDPQQLENLVAYHQELARHDFAPSDTGLVMPLPPEVASTSRTAGTQTCRQCHGAECSAWDTSRHARAWQSLVNRGVYYDADCQRCHTTGYGWEGGFSSAERSIGTLSIGCESCHGPSLTHVLNPSVRTPLVASQQCIHCHDDDHSPGFNYGPAWARIQHGPAPAEGTGALLEGAFRVRNPPGQIVN